jgi:hypothetical protein
MTKESRDRGDALLDRLAGVRLLSETGHFVEDSRARPIGTWAEAVELSQSDDWKNLKTEFANTLSVSVRSVSVALYQTWNQVVRPLRDRVKQIVDTPVATYLQERGLPAKVLYSVQWDLLHAALEAHYSTVVPQGIYSYMFEVYMGGFFPCGWEGAWPDGRLLVL